MNWIRIPATLLGFVLFSAISDSGVLRADAGDQLRHQNMNTPCRMFGERHPVVRLEVEPSLGSVEDLAKAAFRLHVPEDCEPRAIVVLLPGSNADGRGLADEVIWQTWAKENRVALLGCFFQDKPVAESWIEHYARASAGSGQVLLEALDDLSAKAGAPDLTELPLAIVGHSAGGQFAYEFSCWRPARVLGFVAHKGGVYFTHLAPVETRCTPGLFFIGGNDLVHRRLSLTGVWSMGRRAEANWALVDETDVGHEEVAYVPLSQKFLVDVLALRLSGTEMQAVAPEAGWLICKDFKTACPKARAPQTQATTGWLPGEASANAAMRWVPNF